MEDHTELIESLFAQAEDYGNTNIELTKLQAARVTTSVLSLLIARAAAVIAGAMFLLILTVGVAMWAGRLLGEIYYGFFAVAGFYALLGLFFYLYLHKWIKKPIAGMVNGAAFDSPLMTEETIIASISKLETKREIEKKKLKELSHRTFESLKPINVVKNALHSIVTSPEIQKEAVMAATSLVAGRIAKKIVTGNSRDPLRNTAGAFMQTAVMKMVANHPEKVELSLKFLKLLFSNNHRSRGKQNQ